MLLQFSDCAKHLPRYRGPRRIISADRHAAGHWESILAPTSPTPTSEKEGQAA